MAVSPASNLIANHSHAIATTYYSRVALDQLMKKMQFHRPARMDVLPLRNGSTIQWYRDNVPTSNITATAEGTVGSGLTGGGSTVSATVSQYSDFMTFSDMLIDTALDPRVPPHVKTMGYRAALSVDTIVRNVVDAAATAQTPAAATALARTDLSQAVHTMQALDIEPMSNGFFFVLCSPYVTYDLVNDTVTGSIQDLRKGGGNTDFMNREDRGFVGRYEQYEIFESTNVTVTTGAPDKFRTYVFGNGGFGMVDLAGRGPSKIMDPKNERFKVKTIRDKGDNIMNPEGKIAAAVVYKFVMAAVSLDATNVRMRRIDTESTIVT